MNMNLTPQDILNFIGMLLKFIGLPVIIKYTLDFKFGKTKQDLIERTPTAIQPAVSSIISLVIWAVYEVVTGVATSAQVMATIQTIFQNALVTGISAQGIHDIIENGIKNVSVNLNKIEDQPITPTTSISLSTPEKVSTSSVTVTTVTTSPTKQDHPTV